MTAKSILEIDVDDGAFKEFAALFGKYKEALDATPSGWDKANVSAKQYGVTSALMLETMDEVATVLKEIAANTKKVSDTEAQAASAGKRFLEVTSSTDVRMRSLARETKEVAGNILTATSSLLKWASLTGVLSSLLGAGNLWGIDRLAASAGGARRSALGLGVTSGEAQAFGINYSRAVDPTSTLGNIADAKSDLSKAWIFGALGIKDYQNRDAADLAPEVLSRAKAIFDRNPTQQAADAFGLTQVLSMDDLRRLHGMSPTELARMQQGYQRDRGGLAVPEAVQQRWQEFTAQMGRAGQTIENVFITGLVKLEKPLEHLSASFVDLVSAFLKSPQLKIWMGEVADGIEHFAKFIGTDRFRSDVEDFVSGISKLVKAISAALGWIASKGGSSGNGDLTPLQWANQPGNSSYAFETTRESIFGPDADARTRIAHDYFRSKGWTESQTAGLLGYVAEESSWNTGSVNPKSGASGLGQWLGARKERFKQAYGVYPDQAPLVEQLDFMQWELTHTEAGAADQLRHTYSPQQAADAVLRYFGRPSKGEYDSRHGVAENAAYRYYSQKAPTSKPTPPSKVDITVHNNTGGSAVVSGSQAGGQ